MENLAIYSATLGLSPPWQVTSVAFAKQSNRLDILVEYAQGGTLICPICGAKENVCHTAANPETWYHDDFLSYTTYLHAHVPQLVCCGGVYPLERPWCRAGSKFARLP